MDKDEIDALFRLVMLIIMHNGKAGVHRSPRGIEPRDDGFGAVEKDCYGVPLSVILVEPLNFWATCSAATA